MDLRADSDDRLGYRILDVSLAAEIKLNDCSYDESLYLSVFIPSVAGSRTEDYSVEGKIIIPVYKGEKSYLILENDADAEEFYFCLE